MFLGIIINKMEVYKYLKDLVCCSMVLILVIACESDSLENEDANSNSDTTIQTREPQEITGAMDAITTLPYSEISERSYTIELDRWDIPSDKTAAEKTTDNLQKAIDWAVGEGYGIIRLPAGHYLIGKYGNDIYQSGIALHSNMAFLLDKEAIIEMVPNDKWNYCAIEITEKTHVVVSGGTIIGDRDAHTYTPRADGGTAHDEGHLICIQNESEYVTVENMILGKANGDGILLVGQKGPGSSVKHIAIIHNEMNDNRRQGVSIVGGEDVLIENNEIHHTQGTSPQFGIDVESGIYSSQDITIRTNYFHHNKGGDIVNVDGRNVIVENNTLEQGVDVPYIDGPIVYRKNGNMTIRNNSITMLNGSVNGKTGIIMYSNDKPKTNPETTYIYENTCNGCGFYMYKGRDLVIRDNTLIEGYLVFSEMSNLTLENNDVTNPSECWAYRFLQVSGSANGNTYNGEIFDIPLSNTPWDGCWIN